MTNLHTEIARRKAIADAATPGPWEINDGVQREIWDKYGDTHICTIPCHTLAHYEFDQPFIAHARTGYPQVLAALAECVEALGWVAAGDVGSAARAKGTLARVAALLGVEEGA